MSGSTTRTLRRPVASLRGLMVAVACTAVVFVPRSTSWISPASVMPWNTRYGVLSAVSWLYASRARSPSRRRCRSTPVTSRSSGRWRGRSRSCGRSRGRRCPRSRVPAFTIRAPPLAKLLPTEPSPTTPPLEQAGGTKSTSWSEPPNGLMPGNFPSASWTTVAEVVAEAAVGRADGGVVVRDRRRDADAADRAVGLALPVRADGGHMTEQLRVGLAESSLVVERRDELLVGGRRDRRLRIGQDRGARDRQGEGAPVHQPQAPGRQAASRRGSRRTGRRRHVPPAPRAPRRAARAAR